MATLRHCYFSFWIQFFDGKNLVETRVPCGDGTSGVVRLWSRCVDKDGKPAKRAKRYIYPPVQSSFCFVLNKYHDDRDVVHQRRRLSHLKPCFRLSLSHLWIASSTIRCRCSVVDQNCGIPQWNCELLSFPWRINRILTSLSSVQNKAAPSFMWKYWFENSFMSSLNKYTELAFGAAFCIERFTGCIFMLFNW